MELTRIITSLLSKSRASTDSIPTTESSRDLSEGELALLEMDADFLVSSDTVKAEKVKVQEQNRLIRIFGTKSHMGAGRLSH